MEEVGVWALKRNALAVLAQVVRGEPVIVTDRGRQVVRIVPLGTSPLAQVVAEGRVRPARRRLADLPTTQPGPALTPTLRADQQHDRY